MPLCIAPIFYKAISPSTVCDSTLIRCPVQSWSWPVGMGAPSVSAPHAVAVLTVPYHVLLSSLVDSAV